jgi:histidinol-phosphate aminotransferase
MPLSRRALLRHVTATAVIAAGSPRLNASAAPGPPAPVGDGSIRLDSNENPFGPSEHAVAAMQRAADLSARYPAAYVDLLRDAIAAHHAVASGQVMVSPGSGAIIRAAATTLVGPAKTAVMGSPGFPLFAESVAYAGARLAAVPLTKAHAHDLDAMLAAVDGDTRLVYVCNPNNPTGSLTRRTDLDRFLEAVPSGTYVLVDEAYHHFVGGSADYASLIGRASLRPRTIVTRTFSAVYGLAGLRIGYAVADPETVRLLRAGGLSDAVTVAGAMAAVAALADQEHVRRCVKRNADIRQEFFNQANARMLRAIDSHTNFVLLDTQRATDDIGDHFRRHGILIAAPAADLRRYIRVSLGTEEEMQRFWRVWDLLPMAQMSM